MWPAVRSGHNHARKIRSARRFAICATKECGAERVSTTGDLARAREGEEEAPAFRIPRSFARLCAWLIGSTSGRQGAHRVARVPRARRADALDVGRCSREHRPGNEAVAAILTVGGWAIGAQRSRAPSIVRRDSSGRGNAADGAGGVQRGRSTGAPSQASRGAGLATRVPPQS